MPIFETALLRGSFPCSVLPYWNSSFPVPWPSARRALVKTLSAESRKPKRPLLFLDVDGQLLPFGDDPQRDLAGTASNSHLARLNPQIGPRLAALPCDLAWATTWEEEANIELAQRLGLPQLPVVNWPESSAAHEREDQWFGLH
ncbi:hypothetical protein ACH41H_46775 [Streptomyces sp. NPDC020800]|uniref:hypothetical protein n=1 Tax=Streptomyces sp. NPDC020800 TaxID=3365092 RepID=UPI003789EEC4